MDDARKGFSLFELKPWEPAGDVSIMQIKMLNKYAGPLPCPECGRPANGLPLEFGGWTVQVNCVVCGCFNKKTWESYDDVNFQTNEEACKSTED